MEMDTICADVLDWCESYSGPKFHALLCDAPYGLTNERRESICNRIARALVQVSLPNFDKIDTEFFEEVDLSGIPLDGSPLSRRRVVAIIKSGVSVSEGAIDFDSGIMGRQKEIKAGSESTSFISDNKLMNEFNAEPSQFLGDYILDTRDMSELIVGDAVGHDFAEFSSGCFAVPITLLFPDFSEPLAFFLQTFVPGFANIVGLCDNSLGETETFPL